MYIAVIKADIIHSRKLKDPETWLEPLKKMLNQYGKTPKKWEIVWGDSFQLEIEDPLTALEKALTIKSLIKSIASDDAEKKHSQIDVRMSIGIGEKNYQASRISESNGDAFIFAGEKFDLLRKEKTNLAVRSPWPEFDHLMNLYFKLASLFMDNWTISSAELVHVVLQSPQAKQTEIGTQLGIKQNSVSDRYQRANIEEMLRVNEMYKTLLQKYLS